MQMKLSWNGQCLNALQFEGMGEDVSDDATPTPTSSFSSLDSRSAFPFEQGFALPAKSVKEHSAFFFDDKGINSESKQRN